MMEATTLGQVKLNEQQQQEWQRQWEILQRGTVEIVPEEEFKTKLAQSILKSRPLKVKLGLDPTAPDIHIGHTVVFHKLRQFQDLGHEVQLIIGDFTGRIGDPTGKSETRKKLTEEDVKANAQTYIEQLNKILDPDKTTIYYNSEWLSPMQFAEVIELAAKVTVARMLERDEFTKRYQSGQAISIYEFLYPLMQGYDSVYLKSDVELGGTDQKFNLLMGRVLQKEYNIQTQAIMTTSLLEGLDGIQKMSKSLRNYIGVNEPADEIFGKSMSIPDELMEKYLALATDLSPERVQSICDQLQNGSLHPRDCKMLLGRTLVRMYHGEQAAADAEQRFRDVFQKQSLPEEIDEVQITALDVQGKIRLDDLLIAAGLQSSKAEAKRSVKQGGVQLNQIKLEDPTVKIEITHGDVLQVGKRKFARLLRG